jgi:hypothetical protein
VQGYGYGWAIGMLFRTYCTVFYRGGGEGEGWLEEWRSTGPVWACVQIFAIDYGEGEW